MEIGSIFEINPKDLFSNEKTFRSLFPFERDYEWNFSYFNTGRAAIEALLVYLKRLRHNSIWLPSYDCDSVLSAAKRAEMDIHYYRIGKDFKIVIKDLEELSQGDILYVVNLFGKKENEETIKRIATFKESEVIVIEDLTLALFSEGSEVGYGDYVIGSVRKWLPQPDGGFIASQYALPDFKKEQAAYEYSFNYIIAQIMKYEYLNDTKLDKQQFLNFSNKAMESLFSDYTIREMSAISKKILNSVDFAEVAKMRKNNYRYLYKCLSNIDELKLMVEPSDDTVPLGLVIATEDRDSLFCYLVQNNIYCNIHWRPNESTMLFDDSNYLSKHCLTIPCDQRYNYSHFDYITQNIKKYYHYV